MPGIGREYLPVCSQAPSICVNCQSLEPVLNSLKAPPEPCRRPVLPNRKAPSRSAAARPPSRDICDACYTQLTTRATTQPHSALLLRGESPALAVLKDRSVTGTFKNYFCPACKSTLLQHFDELGTPGGFRLSP